VVDTGVMLLFKTGEDFTENMGGVLSDSGGGSIGLAPIGLGGCTGMAGDCCRGDFTSPNDNFDLQLS